MKMNKTKLTTVIAIATVACLMVGAFAFFTDRVTTNASASTARASDLIDVDPDPTNPSAPDDPQDALEAVWTRENPDKDIVKPGDLVDLSFDLKNIGSSDIDCKETIVLTSKVNLDQTNPEWRLFLDATADEYGAMVGGTVVSAEQISAKQVKYTLAAFKLSKNETKARNFKLVFDKYATNAFQGDVCTIDYLCEMRQHVDSIAVDANWDAVRTDTIRFAGQTTAVVPAA